MDMGDLRSRGLVILGCGKMGSAILAGWLKAGLEPAMITVKDPAPSQWLQQIEGDGLKLNQPLPTSPAIVLIAVKPQMMAEALPVLKKMGDGQTLFISVAAGTSLDQYEQILGAVPPIIRAMPNTPAAIGRGITAIIGNDKAGEDHLKLAEELLASIGQVVRIASESQMDAVTAVSGSGPAYVFHLIETMAAAGEAEGLPKALAMQLAKATVAGAGLLAEEAEEDPAQLRVNVTSPGGTTAAALNVLMDEDVGFPALLKRAVHAAAERGRELGK